MPNEQVLPLALSGAEIKKIAHDKLDRLLRSCHLNDNLAYGDGVYMKVSLELKLKDMGREEEQIGSVEAAYRKETDGSIVPDDPQEYAGLDAVDAVIEQSILDPTAARIESGQEVPVRVTSRDGKDEVKTAKYRRDAVKK